MAEQYFDRVSTTLGSAYTAGGTSLVLAATLASLGITITGTTRVLVAADSSGGTAELFKVTAGSGSTLTVVGAQGNPATTASNHAVGATVTFVLDTDGLTNLPLAGDATGTVSASTIYALAAGAITVAAASILFGASSSTGFAIGQATLAAVDGGNGANAVAASVQAPNGQGSNLGDGGNGASLYLGSGNGGYGGNANGAPGSLFLDIGDAAVVELTGTAAAPVFQPLATSTVGLGSATNGWGSLYVTVDGGGNLGMISMGVTDNTAVGGVWEPYISLLNPALSLSNGLGDVNILNEYKTFAITDPAYSVAFEASYNSVPAGAAGGYGYILIGGSTIIFQPALNTSYAPASQDGGIYYLAQASTSSASGVKGASIVYTAQPGQPATGASHNGGAGGGVDLQMPAGGTSGSATAGATGTVNVKTASGTVVQSWGATPSPGVATVGIDAGGGTFTLSATQLQEPVILLTAATMADAGTVAFGNNAGAWEVIETNIILNSQTFKFTCGSGSVSKTSFTGNICRIICNARGSNTIDLGGC